MRAGRGRESARDASGSASGAGSIDRYQSRGDFYMPIGGAIPGLLQRRGQERRGMRGHVFHVCDGAHTFFLDLHLLPAGLAYKIVM
jgi:hypothetical protein